MAKKILIPGDLVPHLHNETSMRGNCVMPECNEKATHVLAYIFPQLNVRYGKLKMLANWGARYCEHHANDPLHNHDTPILNTYEECDVAIGVAKAESDASKDLAEQHEKELEEMEMDIAGRITRLSGPAGEMYELPGGVLECVLRNGETIRPCCWIQGGRIIRHPTSMIVSEHTHSLNCLKRR